MHGPVSPPRVRRAAMSRRADKSRCSARAAVSVPVELSSQLAWPSRTPLSLVLVLNPLRLTLCLCGDPAAYIPRRVNDANPGRLRARQKLHRRAVGERDLLEVESDAIDRFVR